MGPLPDRHRLLGIPSRGHNLRLLSLRETDGIGARGTYVGAWNKSNTSPITPRESEFTLLVLTGME